MKKVSLVLAAIATFAVVGAASAQDKPMMDKGMHHGMMHHRMMHHRMMHHRMDMRMHRHHHSMMHHMMKKEGM